MKTVPGRYPLAALLAATASCCGGDVASSGAGGSSHASGSAVAGAILVSAASSLTDAFGEVAAAFEAAHPGADVVLNLGGSASLRAQILEGAPVDVFASADLANMERVAREEELAGASVIFAHNRLRVAVPAGNPADVRGLADLSRSALRIGLCAPEVPCGAAARIVLARAGVTPALDTNEPDVRALLTKLELGELDAGIVYVTDVASAGGRVEAIAIPGELDVAVEYPIAVLAAAPNRPGAEAFVRFVLSEESRAILSRYGFAVP